MWTLDVKTGKIFAQPWIEICTLHNSNLNPARFSNFCGFPPEPSHFILKLHHLSFILEYLTYGAPPSHILFGNIWHWLNLPTSKYKNWRRITSASWLISIWSRLWTQMENFTTTNPCFLYLYFCNLTVKRLYILIFNCLI